MLQQFYPQPPAHPYVYELNKDMQFAAAHCVPHPSAGVCQNVHGHTYFVNVTIAGDRLDEAGFLINFKDIKKAVHGRFDHKILNADDAFNYEHGDGDIPSTEAVAQEIWYTIQGLLDKEGRNLKCLQVVVRETPTSYVIYRPNRES